MGRWAKNSFCSGTFESKLQFLWMRFWCTLTIVIVSMMVLMYETCSLVFLVAGACLLSSARSHVCLMRFCVGVRRVHKTIQIEVPFSKLVTPNNSQSSRFDTWPANNYGFVDVDTEYRSFRSFIGDLCAYWSNLCCDYWTLQGNWCHKWN